MMAFYYLTSLWLRAQNTLSDVRGGGSGQLPARATVGLGAHTTPLADSEAQFLSRP